MISKKKNYLEKQSSKKMKALVKEIDKKSIKETRSKVGTEDLEHIKSMKNLSDFLELSGRSLIHLSKSRLPG